MKDVPSVAMYVPLPLLLLIISNTNYNKIVHAKLGIAQENSGKLVTKLREIAKKLLSQMVQILSLLMDHLVLDIPLWHQ